MKIIKSDVKWHQSARLPYTQNDVTEITEKELIEIINDNIDGTIIYKKSHFDYGEYQDINFDYMVLDYNDYNE